MGLFSKLLAEFIDIIEWSDSSSDTIVWRFERYDHEIKNGAKLTVRESQVAIFVNEGKIADVFNPGLYTLTTQNLPILTTLKSWPHGFSSPFKAEVYFINTKKFLNQKWGTPNVFYVRDADFGRVSLRAFGTFGLRVADPLHFLKEIVGTKGLFSTEEIDGELRSMVISQFIDAIGESKIPLLDFAQNYNELSTSCQASMNVGFTQYGLEVTSFYIQSINLPDELQKKLDEGTGVKMVGDLNQYSQMKAAEAMSNAAANTAGGGAEGMMGIAMMQQMLNNQQRPQAATPVSAPPPVPGSAYFIAISGQQQGPFPMLKLKEMIQTNQINKQTYIWKEGMSEWLLAEQVSEVAALFTAMPPPPPSM